jgi:hypothetical protein
MKGRNFIAGLALTASAVMAGCGESTGPDVLDEALTLNAALVAADATLEDVALARTPFSFGPQGLAGHGMGPGGMGVGGMGEPGGHRGFGGDLSGTRSVTFYDAEGHEQEAYDSLTTATIHVVMEMGGEVGRTGWSGSVSRTRDLTISGLEGSETTRTFDGTGSESISRSRTLDDGAQASFNMEGTFIQTALVVPIPRLNDHRYPLSGTITRTLSVTVVNGPDGDRTRTVNVVVTFNGTNIATAVVDGETFEIDLDTRPGGFPLKGRRDRP